jgi:hypothetical protein
LSAAQGVLPADSCGQCAKLYVKHNLSVALMTGDGWVELDGKIALQNALNNAQILKEREEPPSENFARRSACKRVWAHIINVHNIGEKHVCVYLQRRKRAPDIEGNRRRHNYLEAAMP